MGAEFFEYGIILMTIRYDGTTGRRRRRLDYPHLNVLDFYFTLTDVQCSKLTDRKLLYVC